MCVFQCRLQFADWVVDDHVCLVGVVDSDRWLHFDRSVSQSRSHDFRRFSRQRRRLFFFFCRLRTLILFEPATNARRFGRSRTNDLLVVRSSLSERPVSCKSLLLLDSFLSTIYEIGASIFSADNSKISRPNRGHSELQFLSIFFIFALLDLFVRFKGHTNFNRCGYSDVR